VVYNRVDFVDEASGYTSTATIEPYFDGLTPVAAVSWTIISVQNPNEPWWLHGASDMNGLTWGTTANDTSFWTNSTAPEGSAPTGAIAYLTDIVGQRTVTVRAQTVIGAVTKQRDIVVTFGNGPLSVFATAPTTYLAPYSTMPDVYMMVFASGMSPTMFPASVAVCGGVVRTDLISVTGLLPNLTISFDTTEWISTGTGSYASTQTKLPSLRQLISVSRNSVSGATAGKGAAVAAGWDIVPSPEYWTNAMSLFISGPPGSEFLDGTIDVHKIDGTGPVGQTSSPLVNLYAVCVH
jgi:hypothetical protein